MARELDAWPVGLESGRQTSVYPWDRWLNGRIWELTQGEDYKVKAKSVISTAQAVGRKKGGRVRAQPINNGRGIIMQYLPPEPGPEPQVTQADTRSAEIRNWGRSHGWPNLSNSGRVPAEVVQAYERAAAHPHGDVQ